MGGALAGVEQLTIKPWETNPEKVKQAQIAREAGKRAKRSYSRAITKDVTARLTKDVAIALAREYVKHGDMRHALILTGFADEDTSPSQMSKMATRVRQSRNFAEAFDHIVTKFDEHEMLTRDRVLAGLFLEASDRFGPTSAAARVSAWSKLATLIGMDFDAKRTDDFQKELAAPGGVLMVPFVSSIEQWEQSAMSQQAQLKADVRT